jgi:hypothetical protein
MRTTVSSALLATALAVTIAGGVTGTSLRGAVRDVDPATICAAVAWPWIPAACLDNGSRGQARYVTADNRLDTHEMKRRFVIAFE